MTEQTCKWRDPNSKLDWPLECGFPIVDLNECTKPGCTKDHKPQLFCEKGHPVEAKRDG